MDNGRQKKESWLAGELARETGVSTDTLRHYERKGVLARPRRGANGYRLYPADSVERVLVVRRALTFGFTLDELARMLDERDRGAAPCRQVRRLLAEKLENVETQISQLTALRAELRQTLSGWDERLRAVPDDAQARLLDSLPTNGGVKSGSKRQKGRPFPYNQKKGVRK